MGYLCEKRQGYYSKTLKLNGCVINAKSPPQQEYYNDNFDWYSIVATKIVTKKITKKIVSKNY